MKPIYENIMTRVLEPVYDFSDLYPNFVFVNCSLGYDGNVNILFADGKYDYLKARKVKNIDPVGGKDWGYRIVKNYRIYPPNPQDYKLLILDKNNHIIEFRNKNINYTHGLQVDTDKFCFICHTLDGRFRNNAKLTNGNGKILKEFTIGTGVKDVQTNKNHELWVSYTDYGINTNYFKISHEYSGINCFDTSGNIIYTYNCEPFIDECNSLNVISENEVIISIYTGSLKSCQALGKIRNKSSVDIIEWHEYTYYLAYSNNKILVERNYYSGKNRTIFILLDIKKRFTEIGAYEFVNKKRKILNCIHGENDTLYFWEENALYKVSISELI